MTAGNKTTGVYKTRVQDPGLKQEWALKPDYWGDSTIV